MANPRNISAEELNELYQYAMHDLQSSELEERGKGLQNLYRVAKKGHVHATDELTKIADGTPYTPNYEPRRAAEAKYRLGLLLLSGKFKGKTRPNESLTAQSDQEAGMSYFRHSCTQQAVNDLTRLANGNSRLDPDRKWIASAQYCLGLYYWHKGNDQMTGIEWLYKAAVSGYTASLKSGAADCLVRIAHEKNQDHSESVRDEVREAKYRVGLLLLTGKFNGNFKPAEKYGSDSNQEAGIRYLRLSETHQAMSDLIKIANKSSEIQCVGEHVQQIAEFYLGRYLMEKRSSDDEVEKDIKTSISYYCRSAEGGYKPAQDSLMSYAKKNRNEEDFEAQFGFGLLCFNNKISGKTVNDGIDFLSSAAKNNHPEARSNEKIN